MDTGIVGRGRPDLHRRAGFSPSQSISVVIPSRLARNPADPDGKLYLDRSWRSVVEQTIPVHEVIVAVDPGHPPVPDRLSGIKVVAASSRGQAAAMNAGARAASGGLLAFLEDDDQWAPRWLECALMALASFDFVSGSQREVSEAGEFIRNNDYPTPSGWVMSRKHFLALGGLDESYRWHLDNDFIGKLGKNGVRRVHLVEEGARDSGRPTLNNVGRNSILAEATDERSPLIIRTVNTAGGMAQIATNPESASQSAGEFERLKQVYGMKPW